MNELEETERLFQSMSGVKPSYHKVYIRGNYNNGQSVIDTLVNEYGGINDCWVGDAEASIYFIDSDNNIDMIDQSDIYELIDLGYTEVFVDVDDIEDDEEDEEENTLRCEYCDELIDDIERAYAFGDTTFPCCDYCVEDYEDFIKDEEEKILQSSIKIDTSVYDPFGRPYCPGKPAIPTYEYYDWSKPIPQKTLDKLSILDEISKLRK